MTVVPLATFGMIFGNFLASVADETTGISLTTSFFNTISSFTGDFINSGLSSTHFLKITQVWLSINFLRQCLAVKLD